MNNNPDDRRLDEFFNDESEKQLQVKQKSNPYHPAGYAAVSAQPHKRNTAMIVLLSAVLVVGIAILALQIFRPSSSDDNQNLQDQSDYEQPHQNGSDVYDNNPNFFQGVPDGEGPFTYGSGSGESSGALSGELYINGQQVLFRSSNGTTEYSTDGGKTWSETPPEGMPPSP